MLSSCSQSLDLAMQNGFLSAMMDAETTENLNVFLAFSVKSALNSSKLQAVYEDFIIMDC